MGNVKDMRPPFKYEFKIKLLSNQIHGWRNILHYGNTNAERGLGIWMFHNTRSPQGLFLHLI